MPQAWNGYSFRAESPCIGHYREYPRGGFNTSVTENMVTIIVKPVTIQERVHLFTLNKNQFTVIISETNCTVNKGIRRVYGMNPFALRVILLPVCDKDRVIVKISGFSCFFSRTSVVLAILKDHMEVSILKLKHL